MFFICFVQSNDYPFILEPQENGWERCACWAQRESQLPICSDYRRSGYKYLLLLGPAKGHRFNPCPTKTVWRNSTYLNPSSRPEQLPQLFFPGIPAANAVITDQRRSRPVVSHSIIFRLPKSAVFGMGKPTASSLRFRLAELVFSDHSADAHVIGTII
jgi:hypothetical protein